MADAKPGASDEDRAARFPIEDLIDGGDADYDQYFDHQHFAALARLEDESYWPVYRRGVILDHVRAHFSPTDSRLIDVGCGVGVVATYLNQQGYHVDYADAHDEALRIARERAAQRLDPGLGPRRFMRVDVTRQALPAVYHGALLLDVLEHLPDDRLVLRSVRDQLARSGGGTIIFTVPAFAFLWSPWDDMHQHKRRYDRSMVVKLAEDCGLEVRRVSCFFAPLFFAAALVKAGRTLMRPLARSAAAPARVEDLVEGRSNPLITKAMLSILALERRVLQRRDLPVGTSIICVAKV